MPLEFSNNKKKMPTDRKILEKKLLVEALLLMKYGFAFYESDILHEDCSICSHPLFGQPILETKCFHAYHIDCLMTAIVDFDHVSCPDCMKDYVIKRQ